MAISRWRTPEDARAASGLIGPNAILQLLPVLDQAAGRAGRDSLLARAGIVSLPDGASMIPEADAARLHRQLRLDDPAHAPVLATAAGRRTADYILAHRIPQPAQRVLKHLPASLAAWALSRAIATHAWTFAGSGRFHRHGAWRFEIADNPLVRGEVSQTPLCHWHAAVFGHLYATLVHPSCRCVETECGAQTGGGPCRFTLFRVR